MSGTASTQPWKLDDAEAAYDALAEQLEVFIEAWEAADSPPALTQFVPSVPGLRKMSLVELIKVDLEYRYQRGCPRPLEEYFREFPELVAGDAVPFDLVYEDFHVRKQAGEEVDAREYVERFPHQREKLERLLGLDGQYRSTRVLDQGGSVSADAGQQLDDFDLIKELGAGSFAKVFLARQRSMQRLVALKISADQSDEPQTLAQLDHPHIVRVFDQRVMAEGIRLLYMQYVAGGTLQEVIHHAHQIPESRRSGKTVLEVIDAELKKKGETPPSETFSRRALNDLNWCEAVCRIGASLAMALDYAHHRGVLHRDIKPANVLLTSDGSPKLADFNISFSSEVEGANPREFFGGSLAYMSPEQLEAYDPRHARQAEEIDGRADTYSLGVMLWEMLTGARPFVDYMLQEGIEKTIADMTERRQLGVPQAALKNLPPECPLGLKEVLLKCLAADPNDRYDDAGQLARQLLLCLEADVQDLLHPGPDRWRKFVRGIHWLGPVLRVTPESWRRTAALWPITFLLLAALLPNAVFSVLNIGYNSDAIVQMLNMSNVDDLFHHEQLSIVNAVAYSAGIALAVYLTLPIFTALRRQRQGREMSVDEWVQVGPRCLKAGSYVARISMAMWIITSLAFPIWIQLAQADEWVGWGIFLHFFASTALCGLIASALAFFFVTYVVVRALYPRLVPQHLNDPAARDDLFDLGQRVSSHFAVLVTAPLLAFFVMAFWMMETMSEEVQNARHSFAVLALLGAAGFFLALKLGRRIQSDLSALQIAVAPQDEPLHRGETPSSLYHS